MSETTKIFCGTRLRDINGKVVCFYRTGFQGQQGYLGEVKLWEGVEYVLREIVEKDNGEFTADYYATTEAPAN